MGRAAHNHDVAAAAAAGGVAKLSTQQTALNKVREEKKSKRRAGGTKKKGSGLGPESGRGCKSALNNINSAVITKFSVANVEAWPGAGCGDGGD